MTVLRTGEGSELWVWSWENAPQYIYISYISYKYTYRMHGDRKTDIPCLLGYNNVYGSTTIIILW